MDQLCTKCGAGVPAGAKFCATCGATIGSTEVPAAAAPPPFTPVQPSASAGYAPVSEPFTPVQPQASTGYSAVPPVNSGNTPVPSAAPAYTAAPSAGPVYTPVPPAGSSSGSIPPQTPPASPGYTAVPPAAAAGYSSVSSPPPNPPGYTSVPSAGGYGSVPMAVPARGGSSAVKIVLIIVAVFVGLGLIGASVVGFAVWRVARAVHVRSNRGEFSMNTPSGKISAHSASNFTADELGTDIYPGAQSVAGGMKMNLPTGSMVTGIFLTTDSKDAVRDFYKAKLGTDASIFDTGDGAVISVNKSSDEHVMVTVSARENENDGKTKIVIVHSKKSGS